MRSRTIKTASAILLAAVMLLSLGGCRLVDNIREVINGVAAHEEGVTDAPVTEKPGTEPAGPTDVPAAPTEDATGFANLFAVESGNITGAGGFDDGG